MRIIASLLHASFILLVLIESGCEPSGSRQPLPKQGNDSNTPFCVYYAPAKIDIMPLTEFKVSNGGGPQLDVYISLLDSAGSQIKFPVKLRFELYDQVRRSPEPKGRRVGIWPQEEQTAEPNNLETHWFDLANPAANNRHWRDFVRAYQFSLPFRPEPGGSYILEATCLTAQNRRLTAQLSLK
ncbi:MAG: hypothetical protein JXN61_09500 [Sedimentisphaerales bacterium]|nr:hypothetical protein [Sedimentisphaerales bacterium]